MVILQKQKQQKQKQGDEAGKYIVLKYSQLLI